MGNSMGGLIALLESVASPDLVRGTALVDAALPRPLLSRVDPRVALQFAVVALPGIGEAAVGRRRTRQSVREQVQTSLKLCTVDPARVPAWLVDEGIRTIESRTPGEFSATDVVHAGRSLLRLLGRPQVLRRRFQTITAPVLMLHGSRDRLVSIAVARATAKEFPRWRFDVADDIGHVPMMEDAEWTAARVLEWLERDAAIFSPSTPPG